MIKSVLLTFCLLIAMTLCVSGAENVEGELALTYSAEDGQAGNVKGNVEIDDSTAALGDKSFRFGDGSMNIIELPGSKNLKDQFTLAAFVKCSDQTKNMRLFSNYAGRGKVGSDVLLVDLLREGGKIDLRLFLAGKAIRQPLDVNTLSDGWHHFAIVFDKGQYAIFFDGMRLLKGEITEKSLNLAGDLRFGEDLAGQGDEQFSGNADNIMVLATAMNESDIAALAKKGVKIEKIKVEEKMVKTDKEQPQAGMNKGPAIIDFSNKADVEKLKEAALAEGTNAEKTDRKNFVELLASGKAQSEIITKTFAIDGGEKLFLNLDASKGFVQVDVLDANGKSLPGYSKREAMALVYDTTDQLVKWNSHATLPNKKMDIKLKITGQNTKLYAVYLRKPAIENIHNPGLYRQILADYWLVDKLEGKARREVKRPVDRGVVMTLDKPWEGNTCAYATIIHDKKEKKYRLYFRGWNHVKGRATHDQLTCYAESQDGIHWTRPVLNKVEFKGSKENNILDGRKTPNAINGSFTPFIDTNPDAKEGERYKAIAGESRFASFLHSENGIDWILYPFTAFQYPLDSQQTVFWHPVEKQYRVYLRAWYYGRGYNGVRGIKTATSKDFKNWSNAEWLVYPDAPVEQLYTNNVMNYYRAPQLTIGFPCRLVQGSNVEPQFMVSRDGATFHRWGETIVKAGLNPEKWGNRCNYMWYGLVETDSEYPGVKELSVYTHERYYRGEGLMLRRHTYRLDGFVSVYAPQGGGSVTTEKMIASASGLAVNYSTAAGGSMSIEVLDENGGRIANSPKLIGDNIDEVVKLKIPAGYIGKPVRLKFHLNDAEVFAFRFVK